MPKLLLADDDQDLVSGLANYLGEDHEVCLVVETRTVTDGTITVKLSQRETA